MIDSKSNNFVILLFCLCFFVYNLEPTYQAHRWSVQYLFHVSHGPMSLLYSFFGVTIYTKSQYKDIEITYTLYLNVSK